VSRSGLEGRPGRMAAAVLSLAAAALAVPASPVAGPVGALAPAPDEGRWYAVVNVHSDKALEVHD
jgi:hypothetical protein